MQWVRKADKLTLAAISIGSISVAVADFTKLTDSKEIPYATLSLVLLGAVGLHLVLFSVLTDDSSERQATLMRNLLGRVEGADITTFSSGKEVEDYLARRIREAKAEVCDLSWKLRISSGFDTGARAKSHNMYEASIKTASKSVAYREIFVFNDPRRLQKMLRRISEDQPGYSCRYYADHQHPIPRLQFVIIDDEEVVIFAMSAHSALCAVRSPTLIRVFKPYFEEAWRSAIPLKEGRVIHHANIEKAKSITLGA